MDEPPPRRRHPRRPTEDELLLWKRVTRDVIPSGGRPGLPDAPLVEIDEPPPVPPQPLPAPPTAVAAAPPPPRLRPTRRLDPSGPVDLDRRTWLRLRRGQYPVDARLDLHGLTLAQAHDTLLGFLASAQARGNRCVLVITGRGAAGGGALRNLTPRWLDEPPHRERVLTYAPAQPRHGGDGAIYVLLRRRS